MSHNTRSTAQAHAPAPAAPAPAAPVAAAAPAPAAAPDGCLACQQAFLVDHEAQRVWDDLLTRKPVQVDGREAHLSALVHGSARVECASILCRNAFHARCLTGLPDDAQHRIPLGQVCMFCSAQRMMPDATLVRIAGSAMIRESACRGTIRWTMTPDCLGIDKCFRLLCVRGAATSRTIHNRNVWPSDDIGQLVINGMAVQTPQLNGVTSPVLDVSAVIQHQNAITQSIPPRPGQAPEPTRFFVMLLCMRRTPAAEATAEQILDRKVLMPAQCLLTRIVNAELSRRVGRFLDADFASLAATKRVWKLSPAIGAGFRPLAAFEPGLAAGFALTALPWSNDDVLADATMNYGNFHVTSAVDPEAPELVPTVNLRDRLSFASIKIPARGEHCVHTDVFDLRYQLNTNTGAAATWRCPICQLHTPPMALQVDTFVLGMMRCIAAGQLEGTRRDAERAAIFSRQANGLGPFGVPVTGVTVPAAVSDIRYEKNGSWRAVVEEVIEIDDEVILAPAPAAGADGGAAAPATIQPVPKPAVAPAAGIKRARK